MTDCQNDVFRRFAFFDVRFVVNSAVTVAVLPAFIDRAVQIRLLRLLDARAADVVGIGETDDLRC